MHLVVAFDVSVSVSASLREAKSAVTCFYETVLESRAVASNSLVVFAADAQLHRLDGQDLASVRRCVDDTYTRSGTSFSAVLSCIRRLIEEKDEGSSFFVVFFTDGRVRYSDIDIKRERAISSCCYFNELATTCSSACIARQRLQAKSGRSSRLWQEP